MKEHISNLLDDLYKEREKIRKEIDVLHKEGDSPSYLDYIDGYLLGKISGIVEICNLYKK